MLKNSGSVGDGGNGSRVSGGSYKYLQYIENKNNGNFK